MKLLYFSPTYWYFAARRRWVSIKYFFKYRWQRLNHHFCTTDVWNFSYYNAKAQVHALTMLKNMVNGHPVYGEVQTAQDWDAALAKMIDGFQAIIDMENWDVDINLPSEHRQKLYVAQVEACRARFAEGMRLYTIYYESLWD